MAHLKDTKINTASAPRFSYGDIDRIALEEYVPSHYFAQHYSVDFEGETGAERMTEKMKMFNAKRAKKSWSKHDLIFFVQTLATSLNASQAKNLAEKFAKIKEATKKIAIMNLVRLP